MLNSIGFADEKETEPTPKRANIETRLYLRETCVVSQPESEDRFVAALATPLLISLFKLVIEKVGQRATAAGADQIVEASGLREMYLFQRTKDGFAKTPAFGCMILVGGTFADQHKSYDPRNPLQDTFALRPSAPPGKDSEPDFWRTALENSQIPIKELKLLYEVEIRLEQQRYFRLVNQLLYLKDSLRTASNIDDPKVQLSTIIEVASLSTTPAPLLKQSFVLERENGKDPNERMTWKFTDNGIRFCDKGFSSSCEPFPQDSRVSRLFPIFTPAEEREQMATILKQKEEAEKKIIELREQSLAVRADKSKSDEFNLQLHRKLSPPVGVAFPIQVEVKVMQTAPGAPLAKLVGELLTNSSADVSKALVGVLPLPSTEEDRAKEQAAARTEALAACGSYHGSTTTTNGQRALALLRIKRALQILRQNEVDLFGGKTCEALSER